MKTLKHTQLDMVAGGFMPFDFVRDLANGISYVNYHVEHAYCEFKSKHYIHGVEQVLCGIKDVASTGYDLLVDATSVPATPLVPPQ